MKFRLVFNSLLASQIYSVDEALANDDTTVKNQLDILSHIKPAKIPKLEPVESPMEDEPVTEENMDDQQDTREFPIWLPEDHSSKGVPRKGLKLPFLRDIP